MADCNDTIRELHAVLDDELSPEARVHIGAHLDGCTDCLQAFDFEAEVKAAVRRKASEDTIPAGLLDRIRQCFDPDFDAGPDPGSDR